MSQATPIRTTGAQWGSLEPIIRPNEARMMHGKLKAASAGNYIYYQRGQALVAKDDGSNEWAKVGTSGFGGAGTPKPRLLKYAVVVNDAGKHQLGYSWNNFSDIFSGTVEMYDKGFFKTSEITYIEGSGGINAVQTETVTATGGTRRLTITNPLTLETETTDWFAYNASASDIEDAIDALGIVDDGDIEVTGAGPYVYTFDGRFSGRPAPMIVVDTSRLTGGSSTIANTTTGVVGGTNEVQTETVTASGGTRTLAVTNPNTGEVQTTGALAYNANAATIQAALEGLSNVAVGDITVTGSGPYVYTFGGAYANKDVALIVVGTGSLTGGSSSIAETTVGVAGLSKLGAIVQKSPVEIIELGAGSLT